MVALKRLMTLERLNGKKWSLGYQRGRIKFLGRISFLRMKPLKHSSFYTESQMLSNLSKYKVKISLKYLQNIRPKGYSSNLNL